MSGTILSHPGWQTLLEPWSLVAHWTRRLGYLQRNLTFPPGKSASATKWNMWNELKSINSWFDCFVCMPLHHHRSSVTPGMITNRQSLFYLLFLPCRRKKYILGTGDNFMCLEIGLDTCQMKLYKIHLERLPSWPVERHAVPCCRGTWRWWAILGFGALSNADSRKHTSFKAPGRNNPL